MAKRKLAKETKSKKHFFTRPTSHAGMDEGNRDLFPSLPYIISGGEVTERYYFINVSKETDNKFKVVPEFFGNESGFVQEFPKSIRKIIGKDATAKIFCVFDWDTIYGNQTNMAKYDSFVRKIQRYIDDGNVILCPSMPSFEYWFMLHFKDITRLVKTCEEMAKLLRPHMMSYFSKKNVDLFKVLKSRQYMENSAWVKNLCADGKLDAAIKRAEKNITDAKAHGDLDEHSYSYVYKVFKKD